MPAPLQADDDRRLCSQHGALLSRGIGADGEGGTGLPGLGSRLSWLHLPQAGRQAGTYTCRVLFPFVLPTGLILNL